jgi:hypothetical protein
VTDTVLTVLGGYLNKYYEIKVLDHIPTGLELEKSGFEL